jgi:hypothetical protein
MAVRGRQRLFWDAYFEQANVTFQRAHPGEVLDEGSFEL